MQPWSLSNLQNLDKPKEGLEQMQVLLDQCLALVTSDKNASAMKQWQSADLNNLAYKLVAMMFGDGAWSSTAGQVWIPPRPDSIYNNPIFSCFTEMCGRFNLD